MFYAKYNKNCHIIDDFTSLNTEDLREKDTIILVNGNESISTTNLILRQISHDNKIYDFFNDTPSKMEDMYTSVSSYGSYNDSSYNLRYYNHDGLLLPICNLNNRANDFGEDGFHILNSMLVDYVNMYKNQYYADEIITSQDDEDDKMKNLYTYFILPLNENSFIILLRAFQVNDNKKFYKRDYVIFCDYPPDNFDKLNHYAIELFYCNSFLNTYRTHNLDEFFITIKGNIGKSKYVKMFEDMLFATNYCMSVHPYLNDNNKIKTVNKINKFLNKKLFKDDNFDLRTQYQPVFQHKSGIKSYNFNGSIVITYNGKLMNCSNGSSNDFEDLIFHERGKHYVVKRPEVMKNNKRLQTLYKIAYEVTEFTINNSGINPVNGDYYVSHKLRNDKIIYKDDKGLILYDGFTKYYAKKYGYFIRVYNRESQDIETRYQTVKKLSEKNT